MNTFFSSTSTTFRLLQYFTLIFTLLGLFFYNFTVSYFLLTVLFFYIYSIIGLSITMHRYYSHKSFHLPEVLKFLFTFIAVLSGRGSPLGWVYIHRLHHAYSDKEEDPHSPENLGLKIFGFAPTEEKKFKIFLIKDLMNPFHLFLHKWYTLIILFWILILGFFSLELLYFTWILPVCLIQISQNSFNYFAHTHGYKNFETDDLSKNNFWCWLGVMGEAWHNNHHNDPKNISTKIKWFEFDPASTIIKLVKKNV